MFVMSQCVQLNFGGGRGSEHSMGSALAVPEKERCGEEKKASALGLKMDAFKLLILPFTIVYSSILFFQV